MRTKLQAMCLSGHDNTVGAVVSQRANPQVITGSYDSTVKLWDPKAGAQSVLEELVGLVASASG